MVSGFSPVIPHHIVPHPFKIILYTLSLVEILSMAFSVSFNSLTGVYVKILMENQKLPLFSSFFMVRRLTEKSMNYYTFVNLIKLMM